MSTIEIRRDGSDEDRRVGIRDNGTPRVATGPFSARRGAADPNGDPSPIEALATTLARAASQIDRLCREIHPPAELLEARRAVEVSALCLRNLIDSGELDDRGRSKSPSFD